MNSSVYGTVGKSEKLWLGDFNTWKLQIDSRVYTGELLLPGELRLHGQVTNTVPTPWLQASRIINSKWTSWGVFHATITFDSPVLATEGIHLQPFRSLHDQSFNRLFVPTGT